jgi:hypothetical protein
VAALVQSGVAFQLLCLNLGDVRVKGTPLFVDDPAIARIFAKAHVRPPQHEMAVSYQRPPTIQGGQQKLWSTEFPTSSSWLWTPTAIPLATTFQAPEAVSAVQPTPGPVRSQSAVELAAILRNHQSQRSEL